MSINDYTYGLEDNKKEKVKEIIDYLKDKAKINKSANDDSHHCYTMITNEIEEVFNG